MTDRVQILALLGSVALLLLVLELVRRRRLSEEHSLAWIVSALLLLGVSVRRDLLDAAARWLDVYYPPAVLVLLLTAIVFVASLSFSIVLTRQQKQIDRLTEEAAILAAELRELQTDARTGGPAAASDRPPGAQATGSAP